MKRVLMSVVWIAVLLTVAAPAHAQRRGARGPKKPTGAATIIYKQDFNEGGILDNFQEDPEWSDDPGGAFGSLGALKLPGGSKVAERYIKWANHDTTIAFMYYPHGITEAYFQARGEKAGKNLHAYFKCDTQDEWQFVKIKAGSLVGFGGGASSPGETFRNLIFYTEMADKSVEEPYLLIDNLVVYSGADGQPPTAPPANLQANWYADAGAVSLNWDLAEDDVGVYQYEVYRSETEGFEPARATRIATVNDSYYEDKTTTAGKTYYYRIVGKDVGGFTAASEPVTYVAKQAAGTDQEEF